MKISEIINFVKLINNGLTFQTASNIAKRRIADLSMETISAVQSRTVFTVKEDELLSAIPSTTSGSDLAVFEQVILKTSIQFYYLKSTAQLST